MPDITIIEKAVTPWSVDKHAVEALVNEWGIRKPVTIHNQLSPCDCIVCRRDPNSLRGDEANSGIRGRHRRNDDQSHVIELNSLEPADEINGVLIHELRHAMQSEELGKSYEVEASFEERMYGYWDSSFEVDARKAQEALSPVLRLVHEVEVAS